MKIEIFKPYPDGILPKGFRYPVDYLALSKDTSSLESLPDFNWWFVNADSEYGQLAYEPRKKTVLI